MRVTGRLAVRDRSTWRNFRMSLRRNSEMVWVDTAEMVRDTAGMVRVDTADRAARTVDAGASARTTS